jgi:hypothetical protein
VCIKCNKAIAMIQAYSLSISTFPSWPCYLCIMQHDNVTIKGRSQMQEKQPMSHHRLLMWVQHFLHSRNKERHVPCSKEKKIEYMTKENNKMCTACEKVKFRGKRCKAETQECLTYSATGWSNHLCASLKGYINTIMKVPTPIYS